LPVHPSDQDDNDGNGGRPEQSRAEEGQVAVRPAICTAGAPAADMACRVDPGTSILEGSDVLAN
jgi:hypothetical protein